MVIVTLSAHSDAAVVRATGAGELVLRGGLAVRLRESDRDGRPVGDEFACLLAEDAAGLPVGRASYRRVYGPRAVLELHVGEELWHSGLPELLIASLCLHAARAGITTLLARVPARDMALLALLREEFAARETRDGAHVDVELSTAGPAPSGWTTQREERSSPMDGSAAGSRFAA